ncbi:MAG: glutamate formimidoyltransferase [Planctomycetota bacterium]
MPLVECVPNISEGRNRVTIDALAELLRSADGINLLDVEPGAATNRTVYTFVGEPEAVLSAAFLFIAETAQRIDMRRHKGEHPRQGATDVCPFVPVSGITLEECAALARRLGKRVGEELSIPVYLYEAAASRPERRNLAAVRAGEYESLPSKLGSEDWGPDFGPREWSERVARTGASQIGARPFLVAYNVNLNTMDRKRAQEIALSIRESGRVQRDPAGNALADTRGHPQREAGRLKGVKAVGWVIDEYERAQISMNITNLAETPFHKAFDATCEEAAKRGVRVTGSELVGLIPLQAMLDAGRHYLRMMGASTGVPDSVLVRTAIQTMGLAELAPFDPTKKIIEHAIGEQRPLVTRTVSGFIDELSTDSPAPGGGSVAALCGSLAAALASMVANLSHIKAEDPIREELDDIAVKAQALKKRLHDAIDDDTRAFDAYMAARRLPKKTEAEQHARALELERAVEAIIQVPLAVLEAASELVPLLERLVPIGLESARSDIGVAALTIASAAEGALMNVLTNLPELAGGAARARHHDRALELCRRTVEGAQGLKRRVLTQLGA